MDFKVNDIVVDFTATFGKNFTLVDILQKPVFKDGIRTDEVVNVYNVVCLDKKLKHLNVKIMGSQKVPTPQDGEFVNVSLVGAVARPYVMNNQLGFSVSAEDIKIIKD